MTFDTGIFTTTVLEGGVGSAGEGFDSLADSDFPENNLALFARGTSSSSSELLEKQGRLSCRIKKSSYEEKNRYSQV
jgi:hypothetical protein